MDVRSTYKGARISARKVRDVTREIQGLPVSAALDILTFTPRKAARLVAKTVKAAVADAENNFELSVDNLVIKEATAGEGPTMKRYMPRARGSASPIRKRTSRINIVLTEDAELIESLAETSERKRKKSSGKKAASKKPAAKKAEKKTEAKEESKVAVADGEKEEAVEEIVVTEEVKEDKVEEVAADAGAEEAKVDDSAKEETTEAEEKK
ncbi:MAG: 50S ribosomal protein L22 [Verrucomicrobia bacterium]|nr:50S ribosomal protein L22 [Verrucomicrobiota bacterium]